MGRESIEESDSDTKPVAAAVKPPAAFKKWEGEDEDGNELAVKSLSFSPLSLPSHCFQSDWEESSEEEEDKPTPAPVAPPKKRGTLKAKLAEKEAEKARRKAAAAAVDGDDDGDDDDDDDDDTNYDSDAVVDPREKARRDREKELQADLNNATELFGAAALGGTSPSYHFSATVPIMNLGLLHRFIIERTRLSHIFPTPHKRGFPGIIQQDHRIYHQTTPKQAPLPHFRWTPRSWAFSSSKRCRSS